MCDRIGDEGRQVAVQVTGTTPDAPSTGAYTPTTTVYDSRRVQPLVISTGPTSEGVPSVAAPGAGSLKSRASTDPSGMRIRMRDVCVTLARDGAEGVGTDLTIDVSLNLRVSHAVDA